MYFLYVTKLTIGYGDYAPNTQGGRGRPIQCIGGGTRLTFLHSLLLNLCAACRVSGYRESELPKRIHHYSPVQSWRPLQCKLSHK